MTLQQLLALAIEIIAEEREGWVECNSDPRGKVTDAVVRRLVRKFDSFLTPARETLTRIETQQRQLRDLKELKASQRVPRGRPRSSSL